MNNRVTSDGARGPPHENAARNQAALPRSGHKKSEFFQVVEQFEQKAAGLEKERNAALFSRRSEFRKDYCTLEDTDNKSANEIKVEKQKLGQQLCKIKTNVGKFQRELMNVKPSPEFVEKLKETMEDIENSMMSFKGQQRKIYDDLLHEERTLSQEITALEKKYESWSQLPPPVTAATDAKKAAMAATTIPLPPAVAAFERFLLQTGGHLGGWDDYDHQIFLKIRIKGKNKAAFVQAAASSIPGRAVDDVRQHEDWYTEYLALKEEKKKAIQEWKEDKESQKDDLMVKQEQDAEEEDRRRQRREEQLEKERTDRLARLDEWKVKKELEKAQREEQLLRQELHKTKERECEERRRMEVKAQVEKYAQQKAEEEAILRATQKARKAQEKCNNRVSAGDMARVQERSLKMMEEKQAKLKVKDLEKAEKEKRLQKLRSQVEVSATRDPSRLYKLTQGWEQRKKAESGASGGQPVLHMPHRAVPSWRQGP